MATKSKVTGMKQTRKNIRRLRDRGLNAMAGAMYAEGLHILRDSVPRTPVITSRLRNSQFATIPDKSRLIMYVGYGTKYAYRVHEGIVTRIKDQPRHVQRAFWASVTAETWTQQGRGGAMVASLWKVSEVGGPKFLVAAADATKGGRSTRVQRTFNRHLKRGIGVVASSIPTSYSD